MAKSVQIDPAKLLESADHLAETKGAGRPKAVRLRRAVSSAYYALFHCMCLEGARCLLPQAPQEQQLWMARAFQHKPTKDCCEWVAGRRGQIAREVRPLVIALKTTPFVNVAESFCDLQEARHRADYDHLAPFAKATVLAHVEDARKAVAEVEAADHQDRQAFFVLLALRTNLSRAR